MDLPGPGNLVCRSESEMRMPAGAAQRSEHHCRVQIGRSGESEGFAPFVPASRPLLLPYFFDDGIGSVEGNQLFSSTVDCLRHMKQQLPVCVSVNAAMRFMFAQPSCTPKAREMKQP